MASMIGRHLQILLGLAACAAGGSVSTGEGSRQVVLDARDCGLAADGVTDDGPAIARLLGNVSKAPGNRRNASVRVVFPRRAVIRVAQGRQGYVFPLDDVAGLTIDGGGSTFLLGPGVRFLRLRRCAGVTVRNLAVDFDPLPFADGLVVGVNPGRRFIEVQVRGDAGRVAGGPTHEDGEQAFFGMLWRPGPYGMVSRHYWIDRCVALQEPGRVRVYASDRFRGFDEIQPGADRISLPVPGIAHRYGPGACFEIGDCEGETTIEDVELWSAPWMGFVVFRNRGSIRFLRVNIRPKPGSGRLMSTWRDGFHVKGNRARLLWEDCIVTGMNDDAFNIATHCSRVRDVLSPTEIRVQQIFPLIPMPWDIGGTLLAADDETGVLLGSARILDVDGWTTARRIGGKPAASPVTLRLDRKLGSIRPGSLVWERESANPDTTLRRCRIEMSCRFQSPVRLEACTVTALLWFYREKIEGPYPSDVVVRDCVLRRGRGNPRLAVAFAGREPGAEGPSALHDVVFERNRVWGDFRMTGVDRARIAGNQFDEAGAAIRIEACRDVILEDNRVRDREQGKERKK